LYIKSLSGLLWRASYKFVAALVVSVLVPEAAR
jgi:hypothetical protein